MLAKSDFIEILQLFDNDLLGVVLVLTTIGTFVTLIVSVLSIVRTWNNIAQMRMNQSLVKELLNQGYSVDDIERIVYGGQQWGKRFKRLVDTARNGFSKVASRREFARRNEFATPVPPVKQSA